MAKFDIDMIASDIYYKVDGIDDVAVDNGPDPGTYYVDITHDYPHARILDELEDIVVDYGGSIQGYDMAGSIVTLLVSNKPY